MNTKTSGWVIVATAGTTIDGREITEAWIKDMAELYSHDEYTALIWPEHFRSKWGGFDGKNWGLVEEVKAAKKGGKLRLFARITANQYLLTANADGQKLFTSVELNPDYRRLGRCYLTGLAVTDSPASSGTTRLKFSFGNSEVEREVSALEPLEFTELPTIDDDESMFKRWFAMSKKFFADDARKPPQEGKDVTPEEMKAAMAEIMQPLNDRLGNLEQKFSTMEEEKEQVNANSESVREDTAIDNFSNVVNPAFEKLAAKMDALDAKFNSLLEEVPGQRPTGAGASTIEGSC